MDGANHNHGYGEDDGAGPEDPEEDDFRLRHQSVFLYRTNRLFEMQE
jgi:hypothetical protein